MWMPEREAEMEMHREQRASMRADWEIYYGTEGITGGLVLILG
jgi:hypothetical protein